jgi:hypothetical protein
MRGSEFLGKYFFFFSQSVKNVLLKPGMVGLTSILNTEEAEARGS